MHFTAVKHYPHTALAVFDEILPLLHHQPTKIKLLYAAAVWCM
jgi:hypothetical protein